LRLPKGLTENLSAALDSLPVSQLPQRAFVYHRVKKSQTLSTIARQYRTSIQSIMQANNMRNSILQIGKTLKIPQSGYPLTPTASSQPERLPSSGIHKVSKGDSLWNIANRYRTTVENIKTLNHLKSNHLVIGQALRMPGFKPEPLPAAAELSTYAVQNGDSPFTIAQRHNMELDRLLLINQLTPLSKIFPGQKLYIE
jgi:membrane-bound lytic murein transglycosylase D